MVNLHIFNDFFICFFFISFLLVSIFLFISDIYLTFECLSCLSDHFLKLKIYYGELNFEVIEEEEAYTVSSCIINKIPANSFTRSSNQ